MKQYALLFACLFFLCVGSKAQVDRLTSSLQVQGYAVLSGPRFTGDGFYESCVLGPEGNQIEITE